MLKRFDQDDAKWLKDRGGGEARWRPRLTRKAKVDRRPGCVAAGGVAKRKALLKLDTLRFGSWNCNGMSAERLDYIVGSQDGKFPGLIGGKGGMDLVAVNECHGKEQGLADAWSSSRMKVGGPYVPGDKGSAALVSLFS